MITGTVKFFNTDKGYGFIAPEGGGDDAFVHISAVERPGMHTLNKAQRVSYDLETYRRGQPSAVDLTAAGRLHQGEDVLTGGRTLNRFRTGGCPDPHDIRTSKLCCSGLRNKRSKKRR